MSTNWQDADTWTPSPHGAVLNERFRSKRFDSWLGRNSHPTQNHSLKLLLRVNLKPVSGRSTARDSARNEHPVKDWTADEWSHFSAMFVRRSGLWNRRFWLIPPASFSLLDDRRGPRPVRPSVQCSLITEIVNSVAGAHRTIEVVNLDASRPGGNSYRSNSTHLDSRDVNPRDIRYEDDQGAEHTIKNHYTVAHEIGHAIGLAHIGVLKARPLCSFAIALRAGGVKNVSSHLRRGANAKVCYGEFDSLGLAENIMGLGTRFEEINAKPWLDRIAMHTNTLPRDWKVVLAPVVPSPVA